LLSGNRSATSGSGEDGQAIDDRYRVEVLTSTNELACGEHAVDALTLVAAGRDLSVKNNSALLGH